MSSSSTSALTVKNLAAYLPGGTYVSFTVSYLTDTRGSYSSCTGIGLLLHHTSAVQHVLCMLLLS
jgi:hypothetical protein